MTVEAVAPPVVLLLGPVELQSGGRRHRISGQKLRGIVAQLALADSRVVSASQLIDGLWGEDLPATARNTLQYHVGALRKTLANVGMESILRTQAPGYALSCSSDLTEFAAHRLAGNKAMAEGNAAQGALAYARALQCWRGEALADVRELPFAERPATALESQRLTCLEAWVDAELESGSAEEIVAQLQSLVAEHPVRERLWEQLMLALYRTGRQADALGTFGRARDYLDRELGVQPSARLRELHRAVLAQDHKLGARNGSYRPVPPAIRSNTATRLADGVSTQSAALTGPGGIRFDLREASTIVGRQSGCDLVLADSEASRRHADVSATATGHAITDLGSTNGTYVNGVRITAPTDLRSGDRIGIGLSVLRYEAATE